MRKILQKILRILAKIALKKYKPIVIAITGSVGKTSTKEAIYAVFKNHFGEKRVRKNEKNYNNEIGVPLTIFNLETGGNSILKWIPKFIKIFWMIIFKIEYPDFLVLEMGADKPKDIEYLLNFVEHRVGVITAIGEIPVHVEFFESPEKVVEEKRKIITKLDKNGVAILNYDDERVRKMGDSIDAKVLTYGLSEKADIKATNYELKLLLNEKNISELNFKLDFGGSSVPAKLINVLGVQHLYSALAATAVGITFNINLVEISQALREVVPISGRMHLIKGIKNSIIIDDSYNAALLSMEAGLDALKVFQNSSANEIKRRKIAVLGDMLEIGKYSEQAHIQVGKKAGEIADMIFAIGNCAGFIEQGAINAGFEVNKIFKFSTSDEAKLVIQKKIQENDVIFIKGSHSIKMENIVEEIMAR
ncbi:MAG TPA: Mur ligase family protein [Candidatus Portnoybacteria bacterium]|nr:Mur ligase family protein [Candidatus Portnoybacteria bacterium]HPJ80312.1 Mur ligase family protein [Candidatus Portnoybacteria bacterium]HPM28322.1 Mur ligase family protein [Candidatus Portnoybacteria bacterium]